MTRKLVWETPGLPRAAEVDWKAVAAKAKSKPGKWLKVPEVNIGYAHSVRNGGLYDAFAPAGSFDAVIRNSTRDSGVGDLYVKYVGEDND